jgi:hypothetical protein
MKKLFFKIVLPVVILIGSAGIASAQITSREFTDKKGHHVFTILYYGEKELPPAVREIVKPVYYDYTIKSVEEVKLPGRSVYYIDMEDSSTLKTVRVMDGEMELVRDLVRADVRTSVQGSVATAASSGHNR